MKLHNFILIFCFLTLLAGSGCQEEVLTAEIPLENNMSSKGEIQFVFPGEEHAIGHRLNGEEMVFELRQGKYNNETITAEFDTSEENLQKLTEQFAEIKGINFYELLDKESYTLPASVTLNKDQLSVPVTIKIHLQKKGIYLLPLILKSGNKEIGVQFIEIIDPETSAIDLSWLERTPSVAEPRMTAIVEATENDLRNIGNYMLYPYGHSRPELKRPLFDMAVIFSANINFDEFSGKPVLYYNSHVQRILDNRDIFVKPLQDKGIKVLLSIMPNHQGIGFSNLDINGERSMVKNFAADIFHAVQQYQLDGVMFDDEYADYPESAEAVQPGRPMVQFGSFHFLIKELRELMPYKAGETWKDRHNIIAMYNIGFYSNALIGDRGWCLFSNDFDYIKNGKGKWADTDSYGNPIRKDRKAVKEWVKDSKNQTLLDEIAQIKIGEQLDYIWNANYQRGDNYNSSNEGRGENWIAGLNAETAKQKFGVASFEMSLENDPYIGIKHMTRFWETSNYEAGIVGRTESRAQTLSKQKNAGQTSMIVFNLQYVPDSWNNQPFTNIYLRDFNEFFRGLGNRNSPQITYEGENFNTVTPSYLR